MSNPGSGGEAPGEDRLTVETKGVQVEQLIEQVHVGIAKLRFYAGQFDDLVEENDKQEIELTVDRMNKIQQQILTLISVIQEKEIENGVSDRDVRQWKREIKSQYSPFIQERDKLQMVLKAKNSIETKEVEEEKFKLELHMVEKRHQLEKKMWEEKLQAELDMVEKKLKAEKISYHDEAKLPKLLITPFNGTATDWVRFENMFMTQVDRKQISDEVKFGYLLEMVCPQVRDKISNLKPGTVGYKTAWERLCKEYGQTQVVVNAYMTEIINLATVKGTNFEKVNKFYEKLSKSYDALHTLGKSDTLLGLVMTTIDKLPHVKPDLLRTDENWELWNMSDLITNLEKWLKRNKPSESLIESNASATNNSFRFKKERHWYSSGKETQGRDTHQGHVKKQGPYCLFCKGDHWGDVCESFDSIDKRKKFFVNGRLCFNCGRSGHRENKCKSRCCFKCNARHHTSLCDRNSEQSTPKPGTTYTGYTTQNEQETLPPIIPVNVNGETFWVHLDTGSGRDFISSDAVKKLGLQPIRYETRHILTVNGTKKQSLPVYQITINSLDGTAKEKIEVTGSKNPDFATVRRPKMPDLKQRYDHIRDKKFYLRTDDEYTIHLILGDNTFSRIKTEEIVKGNNREPIVEGTTFGYIIHGGDQGSGTCMYAKDSKPDYERLYSLDVLGIEDRSENDPSDIHKEFVENIQVDTEGRYEVEIPWIPGSTVKETNELQSRKRLRNVERKLEKDPVLKKAYEDIVKEQLNSHVIEKVPEEPTGDKVFYLPHKPICREDNSTTKVRMVFDCSSRPSPMSNSINECMYIGPTLQPNLWDIMIRARMSSNLLIGDLRKAFLQIGLKPTDRDAFRFLFNINGIEEHLRFARLPFGAEASPFVLGATLNYHYDRQPEKYAETVDCLKENTYVDNLMKTGETLQEMNLFKTEATEILEAGKFPVHKWESNIHDLESEGMSNPTKILGHVWDKSEDTLEIQPPSITEDQPVTKKKILSHLGSIYDPLGVISPTLVEGKRIYREACDENQEWNKEVSPALAKDWLKWTRQLSNIKIPRSLIKDCRKVKAVHIHQFADASEIACSTVTIAIIDHGTSRVMGLLTSKSRIAKRNTSLPRLELIGGHMSANMIRNLCQALHALPIVSITSWMDNMSALFWIMNAGKQWKTFVSNRVNKIAQITEENNVDWKYCPSEMNIADIGTRGATLEKMSKRDWFEGPEWLMNENDWPSQPVLKTSHQVDEEKKK